MVICQNKEELMLIVPWINIKDNKVVTKHFDNNGTFHHSCIIPTVQYPMSDDVIQVFYDGNVVEIEDARIIDAFDSVVYKIGHCYENADKLMAVFKEHKIDKMEMYCGWVFMGNTYAVHHCWIVYNNESIIDLSADAINYVEELKKITDKPLDTLSLAETRSTLVEYRKRSKDWKNSQRCCVGSADGKIYIGSKCKDGNEALQIYNALIRAFPNHVTIRKKNGESANPLQMSLLEAGLM